MPNAAPSWSWASIKGGIKYHSLLERVVPLVGIEEASTIPVASDEFGEVQGGFIEVKDRLFVFDGISKEKSLDLIHNDGYLRISLDDYLSTNNGQLYLAPLVKLQAEQQCTWCLLVCQKLSNRVLCSAGVPPARVCYDKYGTEAAKPFDRLRARNCNCFVAQRILLKDVLRSGRFLIHLPLMISKALKSRNLGW